MQRIRSFGVAQMAKVMGVLYLVLGVIFAVIFGLVTSMAPAGEMAGTGFGVGFLVVMPLLYGAFGFVFGALIAWLYNLVAGWTGGLELDLEPAERGP